VFNTSVILSYSQSVLIGVGGETFSSSLVFFTVLVTFVLMNTVDIACLYAVSHPLIIVVNKLWSVLMHHLNSIGCTFPMRRT